MSINCPYSEIHTQVEDYIWWQRPDAFLSITLETHLAQIQWHFFIRELYAQFQDCYIITIEFNRRGSHHMHILFYVTQYAAQPIRRSGEVTPLRLAHL